MRSERNELPEQHTEHRRLGEAQEHRGKPGSTSAYLEKTPAQQHKCQEAPI